MTLTCKDCGLQIIGRSSRANYCFSCEKKRSKRHNQKIRGSIPELLKLQCLDAYNFRCVICGYYKDDRFYTKPYINARLSLQTGASVHEWERFGVHFDTNGLHIHHIRAISDGGKHIFENIIPLCPRCHEQAHNCIKSNQMLTELLVNYTDYVKKRSYFADLVFSNL